MIGYAIGGLVLGLFGAPVLYYIGGTIVLKLREGKQRKQTNSLQQEHNVKVKKMRKEYEKYRSLFNKKTIKMQKTLSKAKEAQV